MTLEERLAALEARVAALEGPRAASPGVPSPADFWALHELQRRAPDGALLYAGHVVLPGHETYGWQMGHAVPPMLTDAWDGAATPLAALGHPLRLELLRRVLNGERTVAEWQAVPALAGSGKLYHHLRDLQAAGWLTGEGRGRYAVPGARVVPLLVILAASGGLPSGPVDSGHD